MPARILIVNVLLWLSIPLSAAEPQMGPVIEAYGPTVAVGDRDVPLSDGFEHRVVFDLADYRGEPTSLNAKLVSVARYLNMHARNGVPVDHMALSAMTVLTVLQSDGFALIP